MVNDFYDQSLSDIEESFLSDLDLQVNASPNQERDRAPTSDVRQPTRKKSLLLTHRFPYPPDRGDRIRAYHILKLISQNSDLWLACTHQGVLRHEHYKHLEKFCRGGIAVQPIGRVQQVAKAVAGLASGRSATESAFFSFPLCRILRAWSSKIAFDNVYVYCSSMGRYLDALQQSPGNVCLDLVDLDSEKWRDYANATWGLRRKFYQLEANRVHRLESRLVDRSRRVLLISKEECDLFKLRHVGKSADSVSNGVDVEYYRVSPELADRARSLRRGSPQFVFVGVLNYQPNSKGILSFCRTIWPHLRRAWPTAELDIVGRYPGREVCDLGQLPGVRVVGSVPDVRPYVLAADISIAPLLIARGVQNKILEALSLARPVIASPQAATGVPEIPGLFVAHTIRQWIQAVEQINGKAPTFNRWGARAREFIVENHSWSAKLQPLNHYLGLSSESEEMGAPRKLSPSRES